ncbi:hypothetical protein C8A05DRAFT_40638 [Staphylotrichum tortipilum]|uniref:Mid2 domain-containing protein n=1 Tax=Staphylotrichum tortipilum TaxID=2831512 RepID=A0AAN6MT30_9PEZI|nr:hypothetical protein C8A05DRAFT_40638 [Staphylotrichum longicolle]
MQLSKALELLVLGLSAMSVAEAAFVDVHPIAGRDVRAIQQRQDDAAKTDAVKTDGTTTTGGVPTTTTPEETTSSTQPPETTTTTSSKPQTTTTSSTPTQTSSSSKTGPSSSTSAPSSSTTHSSSSSGTQSSSSFKVETITQVITSTLSDGSQVTLTSETLSTSTPDLVNNGNSGQAQGMTTQTRNTVIGVVVGVGGAIILGGLALLAWRIWGRKKHQDENDGLMDYGSTAEKPEPSGSMGGRTPFQSTLESYHAPTQVNTAANF